MSHVHDPRTDVSRSNDATRSVVLPVYDECTTTWSSLVVELLENGWDEVVIAADDPDRATRQEAERLDERTGTTLSLSQDRRGKGGALQDGLDVATGDVVGYVDADGAVAVSELDRLYRAVEGGDGDVAIGSRDIGSPDVGSGGTSTASRDGQAVHRRLLGAGYRRLARAATGVDVSDFQCGAKAFNREVWATVADDVTETGFGFDTKLIAIAAGFGYSVSEHPIEWHDPGESDVDVTSAVPSLLGSLFDVYRSRAALGETARSESTADTTTTSEPVRLALVTDHPPNRGHLAEYGEELALAYSKLSNVEVTVLSRRAAADDVMGVDHTYEVKRAWDRDSTRAAWGLLRELRTGGYDAVQFNVHMTYFGESNFHRFLGLSLPGLTRLLAPIPVVTTLHDMLEVVEKERVAEEISVLERAGARAATQVALLSDATTVTAERYREVIGDRYLTNGIVHVPHGTFARADGGVPKCTPPLRLLLFGFLGPTKDVETTVTGFRQVRAERPDAELVVAGDAHPDFPGYLSSLRDRFGDEPGVRFTGYVEEDELDEVWNDASLVLMPYHTCTGVSGVFQLAKSYGKPVLAYDNDGMRTSTVDTGGTAAFVEPESPNALAGRALDLWADRDTLDEMARENAAAGNEIPMEETATRMLDVFVEHGGLDRDRLEVTADG